ncbi:MAG: protein kinase domain-containing protein [Polyangiales bacterium]
MTTPLRVSLSVALGPRTGRVIGGRYRLVAPVAEGGMGSVWRAEHSTLGHAVAVKFLAGGSAAKSDHRARFDREAKIAARIAEDCRQVVKVTDHGVEEDGTPWIVMELLVGEGLDRRLRREPRLPLVVAIEIVRQIARGLDAAHRLGVVHRDLKPANVFLCSNSSVDDLARKRLGAIEEVDAKLLDFGVAKSLWEEDAPTTEGVVLGTLGYMSPEQLTGEGTIDARTDIWALGAIAYRVIVGKPAFGVGTSQEIGARVTTAEPMAASQAAPGVPADFDAVLGRALAKDPKARYATARDFAEALAKAGAVAVTESSLQSTSDGVVASAPPKRSRRVVWALALAALSLVSIFTVVRVMRAPALESASHGAAVQPPRAPYVAPSRVDQTPPAQAAVSQAPVPTPSASASALAPVPVPSGKSKALPKVIDTWKKKDEL